MDVTPTVNDRPDAIKMKRIIGKVEYEGVGFQYARGQSTLRDFDLDIEPGETVALVGPTGAGKTTLVSLLMRLYYVNDGKIIVGGHGVRDVTLESLARQMSAVPQEPFLFSGSAEENIRYNSAATTDDVIRAAQTVGAHEFIMQLEGGYETELEERDGNLSMGQRQMISFVRALARNPRILILDKATAYVDTETELMIQWALKDMLRGRTSLVIAHRLSTVRNADRIVVMELGRIAEQGSHEELMALGGAYYRLQSLSSTP